MNATEIKNDGRIHSVVSASGSTILNNEKAVLQFFFLHGLNDRVGNERKTDTLKLLINFHLCPEKTVVLNVEKIKEVFPLFNHHNFSMI